MRSSFGPGSWLLWLAACGPVGGVDGVATNAEPIYYGTPAPNDKAVVALQENGDAFCSGTLITPTVVLTAAHCLADMQASHLKIFFGQDAYGSGTTRSVTRILQHPNFDDWELTGDVGLIEMSSAAPADVTPIPHLPASLKLTASDVGGTVRFSGYGYTETGAYGTRRQVNGEIAKVCTTAAGCSYAGEAVVWGSFAYSQADGGPCNGDSGGPAFIMRSGTQYVAGMTSYGDQDCVVSGVSTDASAYAAFIDEFIAGGDTDPGQDPPDDPPATCDDASCEPGAPCADDATCGDGFCISEAMIADFQDGYCTANCSSDDDCAGDGICIQDGDQTYCLDACGNDDDCRTGYVCDDSSGTGLCLPPSGGGGEAPNGDGCEVSSDCAGDGATCYGEDYGLPGGLCTLACEDDSECGTGAHCSEGYCLTTCERNGDCRDGWSCWPDADGRGACWVACTSDDDCDGDSCNDYGMCGDLEPPDTTPGPSDDGGVDDGGDDPGPGQDDPADDPDSSSDDGDSTGSGAARHASNDLPEGCNATTPAVWWSFAILGLPLLRRRP